MTHVIFPLRFGYSILVIVGMIFWTSFFVIRKDLRPYLVKAGIVFGIVGLLTEYFWWTINWWHPVTLTGTRVGIEDFFTGFGAIGVMATSYQVFFNKKIVVFKHSTILWTFLKALFIISMFVFTTILLYGFHLTIFYAFSISCILAILIMFASRPDLIAPGLITGILTTVCVLPIYWATILTVPHWVAQTYDFQHLSGVLFTGIPVEELVFWFLVGNFIGPLSAFMRSGEFVSIEK
jgi:hypothetical protein